MVTLASRRCFALSTNYISSFSPQIIFLVQEVNVLIENSSG
jgi:hypothetical protein